MNRLIIIGNGFDMAHGLKTSYKDFLEDVWKQVYDNFSDNKPLELYGLHGSDKIPVSIERQTRSGNIVRLNTGPSIKSGYFVWYDKVVNLIEERNKYEYDSYYKVNLKLVFKNSFFRQLMVKASIHNWVDVENEYYLSLKGLLKVEDSEKKQEKVDNLNCEFDQIKELLRRYLLIVSEEVSDLSWISSIDFIFNSNILPDELASTFKTRYYAKLRKASSRSLRDDYSGERSEYLDLYLKEIIREGRFPEIYRPQKTMVLNFNYTKTAEKLYPFSKNDEVEFVNIHGELEEDDNQIIFGYGDELDDDYRNLEKQQINGFMDNIKSLNYLMTGNYRKVADFLDSDDFQVFILGHSCGNSDRTLLNSIFEHSNCASLKVFYHQREDGSNDFKDLQKNVIRSFKNKVRMRDVVVNKELCKPMIPIFIN